MASPLDALNVVAGGAQEKQPTVNVKAKMPCPTCGHMMDAPDLALHPDGGSYTPPQSPGQNPLVMRPILK